jgi:hypothetical protein
MTTLGMNIETQSLASIKSAAVPATQFEPPARFLNELRIAKNGNSGSG